VAKVTSSRQGGVAEAYAPILSGWNKMTVPTRLRSVHAEVLAAIEDQRAYLEEWKSKAGEAFHPGHPRVQAASQRLHHTYGVLMSLFPGENAANKQAFFDYLCALDFI
jgi:hypothetical protein